MCPVVYIYMCVCVYTPGPKPTPPKQNVLTRSLETGHGESGEEAASPEEVDAALEKMAEEVLGPVRGSLGKWWWWWWWWWW